MRTIYKIDTQINISTKKSSITQEQLFVINTQMNVHTRIRIQNLLLRRQGYYQQVRRTLHHEFYSAFTLKNSTDYEEETLETNGDISEP